MVELGYKTPSRQLSLTEGVTDPEGVDMTIVPEARVCAFPDCGRPHKGNGWCSGHNQQQRSGRLMRPIGAGTKGCSFAGCDREHSALGLCGTHRAQKRRGIDLRPIRKQQEGVRAHPTESGAERLERGGWTVTESDCWEWDGFRNDKGYGEAGSFQGSEHLAHRLSYVTHVGPIPEGMHVRHKCDNPPCVNPNHLLTGTRSDNSRDMMERGRGVYNGHTGKFGYDSADRIRALFRGGKSRYEIAALMEMSYWAVAQVVANKTWVRPEIAPELAA